jgi:carbon starvation protein
MEYPIALFEPTAERTAELGVIVLLGGAGQWVPGAAALGANTAAWIPVVMVYAAIASALPVWTLLQPRDYLSSFLLYAGVGGAIVAIIVGTLLGTSTEPLVIDSSLGAFNGFWGVEGVFLPLFPLLFITIACGTISGFHSLVSSGTTAKQLDKETDARLIGYGGMLGEGLLASVALSALAVWGFADPAGGIGAALPNFASGGGVILTSLGIPETVGAVFMALVLVSFLLTSTDTAVRLGRYMMEEIVGLPAGQTDTGLNPTQEDTLLDKIGSIARGRYTNPLVQTIPAYLLVVSGQWVTLWALFGGANQLLAALALLTGTVWIANWDATKQLATTGVPMALMVTITVLGLAWLVFYENLYSNLYLHFTGALEEPLAAEALASSAVQAILGLVLITLALSLVRIGYQNIQEVRSGTDRAAVNPSDD